MDQKCIDRINELYHKSQAEGLTPEETAERDALRQAYVASVRANLAGQLDNTYIVGPDGARRRLTRKDP